MTEPPREDPYAPPEPGRSLPPPAGSSPPPYGQPAPPPYGQPAPPPYGQPAPPPYGQPAPYAQSPWASPQAVEYASWPHRVGGRLIDAVIVIIPAAILGSATGSRGIYDLVALGLSAVIAYLNGAQGQSPGKRLAGLRCVRDSDGGLIGGGMGIVRELAHLLDTFSLLIGWLFPLWDSKRQTFADKVCGTVVVRA